MGGVVDVVLLVSTKTNAEDRFVDLVRDDVNPVFPIQYLKKGNAVRINSLMKEKLAVNNQTAMGLPSSFSTLTVAQ